MEFKENILSKQEIERVCLNWVSNRLYWYEKENKIFFQLIEKPLYLDLSLLLESVYNNLTRFNENILKNDNLKNENLKYPFSKLHKIVDFYFKHPDIFFRELFYQEDDTHLTDVLDELFYDYTERELNYNNNFKNLNDNIQRYVLDHFNIFAYLHKEDAINLINLLV